MNKKKLFSSIVIISIATLAAFNMNINSDENGISDVSLDNVEALAQETAPLTCIKVRGYCTINGWTTGLAME
jgi:hypothetical protein